VFIFRVFVRSIHNQVFPVANAWHQVNAQQVGNAEDRQRLSLCISMKRVGLNIGCVFNQAINNVDRFPNADTDKVAKGGKDKIRVKLAQVLI